MSSIKKFILEYLSDQPTTFKNLLPVQNMLEAYLNLQEKSLYFDMNGNF